MLFTLNQGPRFQATIQQLPGSLRIQLIGSINEDVNFGEVLTSIARISPDSVSVELDIGQVRSINSCGVREWLLFLEKLEPKYRLTFVDVSEVMVNYANIVSKMLGKPGTKILMLDIPYFCVGCDSRKIFKTPSEKLIRGDGAVTIPPMSCEKCRAPMEFDGIIEEYATVLSQAAAK